MLFSRACWSSGRYGRSNLRASQSVIACRNVAVFAPGFKTKAHDRQPFALSSTGVRSRWLSQSTTLPVKRVGSGAGVEDADTIRDQPRLIRGSSSLDHTNASTAEERTAPLRLPHVSSPSKPSPLDASSPHYSLATFRAHALRTGLSPTSTVYTGTTYEYLTQATLRSYGFDLFRVGGRGDRGVDLIGIWKIPLLSSSGDSKEKTKVAFQNGTESPTALDGFDTQPLKVLVQCKRLVGRHAKIGPNLIRELDGAVRGARSAALFDLAFPRNATNNATAECEQTDTTPEEEARQQATWAGPAIGVLVSTKPATKGVVDGMRRSTRGLVWVMMEEDANQSSETRANVKDGAQDESVSPQSEGHTPSETSGEYSDEDIATPPTSSVLSLQGRVKQILWNQAARDLGLEGVDVVQRYDGEGREEVVLMRGGRVWGGRQL